MSEQQPQHETQHNDKVARINALARKAKDSGLTEAEKSEQQALRRWYIDAMKASLTVHLENIRYVDDEGNVSKPGE